MYRQARVKSWLGELCVSMAVCSRKMRCELTAIMMNSLLGREGEEAGVGGHERSVFN